MPVETEVIMADPHPDGNEGILAIVYRSLLSIQEGILFLNDEREAIQIGIMNRKSGYVVEAHKQTLVQPPPTRDEVLLVLQGQVQVMVYCSNKTLMGIVILNPLEMIYLRSGFHSVEFVDSKETVVLEFKRGPYLHHHDKTFMNKETKRVS